MNEEGIKSIILISLEKDCILLGKQETMQCITVIESLHKMPWLVSVTSMILPSGLLELQ
jgi:hypothetical protein